MDELAALRQAEREANEIIQAARDERRVRLREAQQQAKAEVEAWKAEKAADLESKSREPEHDQAATALSSTTDEELRVIMREFEANKEQVVDLLVNVVTTVKVEEER